MDRQQAIILAEAMIGWETVGVVADQEIMRPVNPGLRDLIDFHAGRRLSSSRVCNQYQNADNAAFCQMLRDMADALEVKKA